MKLTFMGLELKNPVVVSAGPWSGNGENIQSCIDNGAAIVITPTICTEPSPSVYPEVYNKDGGIYSLSLYSNRSIEDWERELEELNRDGAYVFCSIRGTTVSEIVFLARQVERIGADGIQLNLFAPMDISLEKSFLQTEEQLRDTVSQVVKAVRIPVMVRVPHYIASNVNYVKALDKSGAKAISTVDSIRGLYGVNTETMHAIPSTIAGYTGSNIKPISLAATATLSQLTDLDINSVGGIRDCQDILEFIMLGATTVSLGSVLLEKGHGYVKKVTEALDNWMMEKHFNSYDEIKGRALKSLVTFEKMANKI